MGDAACEGGHQIVFVVWAELMVFAPVTSKVACASNLENLGSGTLMTMRATYISQFVMCALEITCRFFSIFSSARTLFGTATFPQFGGGNSEAAVRGAALSIRRRGGGLGVMFPMRQKLVGEKKSSLSRFCKA